MFTLRSAGRVYQARPFIGRYAASANAGVPIIGRRYVQQGYGDDADASIADTPEAREERSGKSESKPKQQNTQTSSESTNGGSKSGGAQPKILNESPPHEGEEPSDVAEHNAQVRKRADNAHEKVKDEDFEKDKVSKKFWAGHGGVDKDP